MKNLPIINKNKASNKEGEEKRVQDKRTQVVANKQTKQKIY
jgi:hypothetical protein